MWYPVGADLVVVLHLLLIGFIAGGVFLTWRWAVIIWAHLPAVIYGALSGSRACLLPTSVAAETRRKSMGVVPASWSGIDGADTLRLII
jgi:Protein of Unknown function (DUF2784)